jgi:hypothetical protein
MVRGFLVGLIFFMGIPFITKTDVAPVSANGCDGCIAGYHGCMLRAYILPPLNVFNVMKVLSSLL